MKVTNKSKRGWIVTIILFNVVFIDAFAIHAGNPIGSRHYAPQSGFHASSVAALDYDVIATKTKPSNNKTNPIKFPKPLTKVDKLKRAATFWIKSAPIVSDYYANLGKLKFLEVHGIAMPAGESKKLWNATHEQGATKLANTISDMKGFYVKAAQIVATRGDLFPAQYTDALNKFQDSLDPMPVEMVKAIVSQELLKDGETFDDLFSEFDEQPLGAASIAQVHRAVLSEKYGSKVVAIKVQRPSIESKLMGDIANLKMIAKIFRDSTPVDFYTIFSEMEVHMKDEFDFNKESDAMDKIYNSLVSSHGDMPILMPRPISGLFTSRVLVMDYIAGTPLSRMQDKMNSLGLTKKKNLGRKFVESLTEVFGRNILETGLFHADLHPGNIMITDTGDIGLIDFGQVKQLTPSYRETVAKIIIALDERKGENDLENNKLLENLILDLGVELRPGAKPEAAAAIAMWLFDGSVSKLPGGYAIGELSPDSPVKEMEVFPQDLVLIARSAVLIKAFANRFGIRWSLAKQVAPLARELFDETSSPSIRTNGLRKRIRAVQKRRLKSVKNLLLRLIFKSRNRKHAL